jgi:hypothetical protein
LQDKESSSFLKKRNHVEPTGAKGKSKIDMLQQRSKSFLLLFFKKEAFLPSS